MYRSLVRLTRLNDYGYQLLSLLAPDGNHENVVMNTYLPRATVSRFVSLEYATANAAEQDSHEGKKKTTIMSP